MAIMDWYSRKVLSWRISNTLEVDFCLEALQAALSDYDAPEIFSSEQGSPCTSNAFTDCLKASGVQVSMDERGRCHDNIVIERLWGWRSLSSGGSVEYELSDLKAFENGKHLNQEVKDWFEWYNQKRYHQALEYKASNQVYYQDDCIENRT